MGEKYKQWQNIFLSSKITVHGDCTHEIKRCLPLRIKVMTNLHSILKSRNITSPTRIEVVKGMFFSSHVWIWELDHKEDWALKNWCFLTVVLEKILVNPLDSKEIKTVNLNGNQSWIFIRSTDAEAEAPILRPHDAKSQTIGKYLDVENDWEQKDKGMTKDEIIGWHHWLNGHEFEQTLGYSEGQRSLVCCSPCGCKESDTKGLNNN